MFQPETSLPPLLQIPYLSPIIQEWIASPHLENDQEANGFLAGFGIVDPRPPSVRHNSGDRYNMQNHRAAVNDQYENISSISKKAQNRQKCWKFPKIRRDNIPLDESPNPLADAADRHLD
jgi:hypothetical protein